MKKILLSLLFQSFYSGPAFSMEGLDAYVVERIERENPSLLQKPFTQKKYNELLKMVHKFSGAKKVSLDSRSSNPRFNIQKRPTVGTVSVFGDLKTSEKERILRLSRIQEGDTIRKEQLEQAAIAIKQMFLRDGFFNASVSLETKKKSETKSDILIKVDRKEAAVVSKIRIQSTNMILNENLQAELRGFLGDELGQITLDRVQSRTREFLLERRYLQARVREPTYSLDSSTNTKASLSLEVENPQRYELSFFGNQKLSKNKILRELDIDKKTNSFGIDIVSSLQTRLEEIYRNQAYPKAKVTIKVIENEALKTLRINLDEGPQVKIFKWNLRGQFSREAQYYIDQIEELGSTAVSNEKFIEKDLKEAISNLNVYLQNQGFLNSNTELERVQWLNSSTVEVSIYLEEGVLTTLEKVIFKNRKAFSSEELLKVMGLEEGGPLNLNKIETSLEKLRSYYLKGAYLDYRVNSNSKDLIQYFDDNRKANLIFDISEGDKIIVNNIIVSGTVMTKESVVRKSLAFSSGDSLSLDRIKDSESQLQKLGIFSSVDIRPLPANSGQRPVLVKVTERKPGVFTFGPGISDELGGTVRAFTGVVYKNLDGSAKVIQGRVEIQKNLENDSFLENKITLSYLEPFLFGQRLRGKTSFSFSQGIDFISSENTANTYIREIKEVNFAVEKDVNRNLKLGWDIWGISGTRRFEIDRNDDQEKLQVASLGPYLELDFRDHPFTPSEGFYTRFNLQYASPRLASSENIEFVRVTGAFNHYIPITKDRYFVLAYSLRGGYVENLGRPGNLSIPQDEMFFLGGRATVRGFELSDLPKSDDITALKPADSSIYYVTDKSYFGLIKLELRFPIYKDFGAAFFYDGGLVDIPEVDIKDPYRHSAGIGFRWYTPVGPVSLEYGLKLDKKTGESDGRIHFSIGAF